MRYADFKTIGQHKNKSEINNKPYVCGFAYEPNANNQCCFNFRSFNTIDEFIRQTNGFNNVAQSIQKPIRYLYFDFDKLNLSADDVNQYINTFINELNDKLNLNEPITKRDFQIHTKSKKYNTDSEIVISIHLISNKYAMKWSEMEMLVRHTDNEHIDKCIYNEGGRLFYNCFNGKVGKLCFEYDARFNETEYKLIWIDDAVCNADIKIIEYKPTITEQFMNINDNPLTYLLDNKNKYLKNGKCWITLLGVVKKHRLMSREEFCKLSLVEPFSYEDNIDYWDFFDLDERYVKKNIDTAFELITNYTPSYKIFTDEFFSYLPNITAEQKQKFIELDVDNKTDKRQKHLFRVDDITFNTDTGLICYGDTIIPYYYEQFISKNKADDEVFNDINIDGLNELIEQFKNDEIKNLFVRALYGVGKTRYVIKPVIDYYTEKQCSIIFITENNTLNTQLADRLNLKSHLTLTSREIRDCKYVITSVESIKRFRDEYDIVIVDECISVLNHFSSDTTFKRQSNMNCFEKLLTILKSAKKIVFCDADLSFKIHNDFFNLFKCGVDKITRITKNPYQDCFFNLWITNYDWVKQVKNGKKLVIPSNVCSMCNSIRDVCLKNEIKFIVITSDGVYLNNKTPNNEKDFVKNVKINIDKYLTENKIQVFCYSPTISTGFSYDGDYFDELYGIIKSNPNGLVCRGFIQMLFRIRRLKDKIYNIKITTPKKTNKIDTIDDTTIEHEDIMRIFKATHKKKLKCENIFKTTILEAQVERNNNSQFILMLYIYFKQYGFNVKMIDESENDVKLDVSKSNVSRLFEMDISKQDIIDICEIKNYDKSERLLKIIELLEKDMTDEALKILSNCFRNSSTIEYIKNFIETTPQEAVNLIREGKLIGMRDFDVNTLLLKFIREVVVEPTPAIQKMNNNNSIHQISVLGKEHRIENNVCEKVVFSSFGYFDCDEFIGLKNTIDIKEFSRLFSYYDNYQFISKFINGKYGNINNAISEFDADKIIIADYVKSLYDKINGSIDNGVIDGDKIVFSDTDLVWFNRLKKKSCVFVYDRTINQRELVKQASKIIKKHYGLEFDIEIKKPIKKLKLKPMFGLKCKFNHKDKLTNSIKWTGFDLSSLREFNFKNKYTNPSNYPVEIDFKPNSYYSDYRYGIDENALNNSVKFRRVIIGRKSYDGLMCKYGTDKHRVKKLREIYDAKKIFETKKEYVINPTDAVLKLCSRKNDVVVKQYADDLIVKNVLDEIIDFAVNGVSNDELKIDNIVNESIAINSVVNPNFFSDKDLCMKVKYPIIR